MQGDSRYRLIAPDRIIIAVPVRIPEHQISNPTRQRGPR
jgi:hypothetical protein